MLSQFPSAASQLGGAGACWHWLLLPGTTRSHSGGCINYCVFMEEVLRICFKPAGSGLSINLHRWVWLCPEQDGATCSADGKCHSSAAPKEFYYFLLQPRISPTVPCRREASISNDSLVILAAYLCVQKAIIAGMHSLFVQLRFEDLASPPPHCRSWIAEATLWQNHQMGTH